MANTSCIRCSQLMVYESLDGLCETCQLLDTDKQGYQRAPGDTPYLMTPAVEADSLAHTPHYGRPTFPPPSLPGYRLLKVLGGGGMGVVYLAHEAASDRLVALKLVRAAADPDARVRFGVEVQSMAQLDHPNVVRVLAVELDRPEPFFTMVPVDGPGLDRRLLDDGPLPVTEAVRIMEQVARGVQHAHDHDVIHRDLKPGNVVVGPDGVAKVTDFGLAKRIEHRHDLTVSRAVLGTPGFMAPEQTGGRNAEVNKPADVYGLGSTLYALLTGHPPFHGPDPVAVAVAVRNAPPPSLSEQNPRVTAGLEAIVLKCLQKDPAKRYASADALADDLLNWQRGKRQIVRPPSRVVRLGRAVRRRRSTVLASLVPLLALFVASGGNSIPVVKATPENPIERAQQDLKANKDVVIVGPNGLPRFPVAGRLNPVQPRLSADGYCEIPPARWMSLMEFFPAPSVNRYRIRMQIRQVSVQSPFTAGAGVYFAHDEWPSETGVPMHSFFAIRFNSFDSNGHTEARFDRAVAIPHPVSGDPDYVGASFTCIASASYQRDAKVAEPWRWVGAEVTPHGIRPLFRETPQAAEKPFPVMSRLDILKQDNQQNTRINNHPPSREAGMLVSPWHPQRPIGIYNKHSVIQIRNMILEPMPES